MISKLVLALAVLGAVFLSAAENETRGYRILHTSPHEFASALSSPLPPRNAKAAHTPGTSRLQKYFRVKSKRIEGPRVMMEIFPDVPMFGSLFTDHGTIGITTQLVRRTPTSYYYDVDLQTKYPMQATMAVEPHPSGSLMTIVLKSTTMNSVMKAMMVRSIFAMGFLAERLDSANLN